MLKMLVRWIFDLFRSLCSDRSTAPGISLDADSRGIFRPLLCMNTTDRIKAPCLTPRRDVVRAVYATGICALKVCSMVLLDIACGVLGPEKGGCW